MVHTKSTQGSTLRTVLSSMTSQIRSGKGKQICSCLLGQVAKKLKCEQFQLFPLFSYKLEVRTSQIFPYLPFRSSGKKS